MVHALQDEVVMNEKLGFQQWKGQYDHLSDHILKSIKGGKRRGGGGTVDPEGVI